jgi:hypothetical protein
VACASLNRESGKETSHEIVAILTVEIDASRCEGIREKRVLGDFEDRFADFSRSRS